MSSSLSSCCKEEEQDHNYNKCPDTNDATVRLQALELLRMEPIHKSAFAKSVALETLLLGELVLHSESLFRYILKNGELEGVMCSRIRHETIHQILATRQHLETLCGSSSSTNDDDSRACYCKEGKDEEDHRTNQIATTFFLYSFVLELSQTSMECGLKKMLQFGVLDYFMGRLQHFVHRLAINGRCPYCEMEQRYCHRSIILLLPLLDEARWKKHAADVIALSIGIASVGGTSVEQKNSPVPPPSVDEASWCRLLHDVLVRGVLPTSELLFEKHEGLTYSVALEKIQQVCLNGMKHSCCLHCRYESDYHRLLVLVLVLRAGQHDNNTSQNWIAPEA